MFQKTRVFFVCFITIAFVVGGCAGVSMRMPVNGFLLSSVSSSDAVTSNQTGNRVGEACSASILGLVATGDASVETARRNGGITFITSVDNSFNNYLGIYSKYCTIVRGR